MIHLQLSANIPAVHLSADIELLICINYTNVLTGNVHFWLFLVTSGERDVYTY